MKESTTSELKQDLADKEKMLATAQGILTGISEGKKQELKHLEETIASTEYILIAMKIRKEELQKSIENLTANGY